jgi:kynureninase
MTAAGADGQPPNRLAGWWGHRLEDRFVMGPEFVPCEGAYGFRLSNPSVFLVTCVRTSLDLFDSVCICVYVWVCMWV